MVFSKSLRALKKKGDTITVLLENKQDLSEALLFERGAIAALSKFIRSVKVTRIMLHKHQLVLKRAIFTKITKSQLTRLVVSVSYN